MGIFFGSCAREGGWVWVVWLLELRLCGWRMMGTGVVRDRICRGFFLVTRHEICCSL